MVLNLPRHLLSLLLAVTIGQAAAATITQTTTGTGISCSNSCVNGVCESTCSDGGKLKIGNGDVITKEVDHDDFEKISVNSISLVVEHGESYQVSLRADSNLMDDIKVDKKGKTLLIQRRNGAYQDETMEVSIVTPKLREVVHSGALDTTIAGFKQAKLSLSNEGAGSITMRDSKVESLRYEGHGNTTLYSDNSQVSNADVDMTGVSEANLSFTDNKGSLKGSVEGVSSVYYCGRPNIDVERSGIVTIEQGDCD